jgi:hypothetical protein
MTVSVNGTTGITFNDASTQNTAATGFGFKNRIINGAMMIDQRNAGASVNGNGVYTLDRWYAQASQNNKFTVQKNAGSVTPPLGFTNYLGVTSSSAYTVGSGEQFNLLQGIEGFNTADLNWGTANAATVTLSFWVRSSLTGTFGGSLQNATQNRSYPFSYTISAANTWEQKSITITGDTSGTWNTTNGAGIYMWFGLGVGSSVSGTAGSWSGSNYTSATGATSVVGTSGATFYITGVQLEKGSTATSFDYRPYGTELALCQRYCLKYCGTTAFEDVNNAGIIGFNSTSAYGAITVIVPMRTSPSISSSTVRLTDQSNNIPVTSIVASGSSYSGPYNINCGYNASSGVVQYRPYALSANNSTSAYVILSAEL